MTASYDCGIETNRDCWQAVHDGLRDGLTLLEISSRTGMSYQIATYYKRLNRPASTLRRINRNSLGMHHCRDCSRAMAHHMGSRCQTCEDRRVQSQAPARVEMLRSWALRHGRVPTIEEAREIVGVSRSRTGDMLLQAFGRDHRNGAHRRVAYRGWPEGSPDIERPGQREALREQFMEVRFTGAAR